MDDRAESAVDAVKNLRIPAGALSQCGVRRDPRTGGRGHGTGRISGPIVSFVNSFVSFVMNLPAAAPRPGKRKPTGSTQWTMGLAFTDAGFESIGSHDHQDADAGSVPEITGHGSRIPASRLRQSEPNRSMRNGVRSITGTEP